MKNSILTETLLFTRNKKIYSEEERVAIKKSLVEKAEDIIVSLIDKVNVD